MKKIILITLFLFFSPNAFAWGHMQGEVDVVYVNTYGNYSESHLSGGYCFKLKGHDQFLKIAYADTGEKKNNIQLVQSMVLAAQMSGKELKVTYVDWGEDPSCRFEGQAKPAKWLENVRVLN